MNLLRCRRCVMPNTRPDTPFVDGICSACLSYERRPTIDWEARKEQLVQLLDRHHGRVLVPSSGGKDSTYQVLTLLEMGADVTVVTARTCHLTAVGRANIDNLARYARTIEVVPNMTVRAKLNRLGLELVGDISWPEHAAIFSTPFRVALDTDHTLLMYGENPQDCYGGPMGSEQAMQMTRRWVSEFGGFIGLRPSDFVGVEGITERDMQDYQPPSEWGLAPSLCGVGAEAMGIEAHFLGQYIPWDSHRNAEVAIAHGMQTVGGPPSEANWWCAENLDNAQTGLHDHFMWLKYGFGRGCQQISVDVRSGRLGRKEALEWVERFEGDLMLNRYSFDGTNFHYSPPQYPYAGVSLAEVLDRIGMTRDRLDHLMTKFKNRKVQQGEMQPGQRVEVQLAGDDAWYPGTVLDRPRKQWVQLDADKYPGGEFVGDETNIVNWRSLIRKATQS